MRWVKRNRPPSVRSLCRVLCGCGRRLAGVVLPLGWGTSTSRLPHMVPRVPAAPNLFVHPLLLISAKSCSLPRLALRVCSTSPSSALRRLATGLLHSRLRSPPSSCLFLTFPRRPMPSAPTPPSPGLPWVYPALVCASLCFVITGASLLSLPFSG